MEGISFLQHSHYFFYLTYLINFIQAIEGIRNELKLPAAAVQIPIGLEEVFEGVIDIVNQEAVTFHGEKGTEIKREPIPSKINNYSNQLLHHYLFINILR